MEQIKKILRTAAVFLLWLGIWQLAAIVTNQEILIPTPVATFKALITLASSGKFYVAVLLSLFRIIIGFTSGVIVGVLGAILSNRFKLINALFTPILRIITAVPVASFIILALVWFYSDTLPMFISFLMVLPMIWTTVQSGIESIDKKYLELAQVYRLKPLKVFFEIKVPFILPAFISTTLNALGFAWKSGIAAEVICRPNSSLGTMLQESKIYMETPSVFALTAVVAILSLLLEAVIKRALRRFTNDKT